MIPAELAKKIRTIQIYTRKAVNASFAGQYESVFKGRGMQFDEVRPYVPGDDIRDIDWNVTARTGRPHVKRFIEEREMTVVFAVDLSASGAFGTVGKLKNELSAEFCAVLAFAAARNNDKLGLLIFTDRVELYIPAKKGSSHILRLIRELLYFKPAQVQTKITVALDYLGRVLTKRATIFLVSDFLDGGDFLRPMSLLNKRHDVIAVCVADRAETQISQVGLIELQDAETGRTALIDTSSKAFQDHYRRQCAERLDRLTAALRSINVDSILIRTDRPYVQDLIKFFHIRHRRR
ncbi:MAG: DUF58 domain-containing protein [Sedimentisphaerales bacterium]|jgi:uncharacterized protein (DUF58 family)|nr:DUF58 domain-containing protein [Sedimentisphaerales bacterium]